MGLAYERAGSGPPLVLLHGVGHRRQAWNAVRDTLAQGREVVLVDLPGHGESPPLDLAGRPAIQALAEELLAFLDEQHLERPHVAGNSLGGALTLILAASGRAATATALSPAGFWVRDRQFTYARAVFKIMLATGRVIRPISAGLSRSRAGRGLVYSAIVSRPGRLSPEQALGDAEAFLAARDAINAVVDKPVAFSLPIAEDVPVTIAWGTRDRLLPPSQVRVARERVPHARFLSLPGCGHVPMTDDPGLVARVLLEGSTLPVGRPA
jgi:pimeloyl-ACP methyl ester carboxylesterase